jgi:hypothetical protein
VVPNIKLLHKDFIRNVGVDVLIAVTMQSKPPALWDVTPCRTADLVPSYTASHYRTDIGDHSLCDSY